MSDIAVTLTTNGLEFGLKTAATQIMNDNGLFSAVCVRLFTDARATQNIIDNAPERRGWWGDALKEDARSSGSLLWTLHRQKITSETLTKIEDYAYDALVDFIERNIATSLSTKATQNNDSVVLAINITQDNHDNNYQFNWLNTLK